MREKIEAILDSKVRPSIKAHGGDVYVMGITNGIVTVKLTGQCQDCPSASLSTRYMIKECLMTEFPEVKDVEIDNRVAPELLRQARKLLFGTGYGV